MNNLSYIVFSDFDGTITLNDVGDKLFQNFGEKEKMIDLFNKYATGEISEIKCWEDSCELISGLTQEKFNEFVLNQKIDEKFHHFYKFCIEKNIPLNILSGGFDKYIELILKREELPIKFYSNELEFLNGGKIEPSFPFSNDSCPNCANCKRNHIISMASDEQIIVYIGNGQSDKCPVKFADIVFAKGSLVKYCEKENITFHRFDDFGDLLKRFEKIVNNSKPKKKRTAELLRREVIMME